MRFSGHETFAIRDGWLHRGLKLLTDNPDGFHDPFVADHLGVGSNMAKSIRHWMLATDLVQKDDEHRGRLLTTPFSQLIQELDPYFIDTGTWWMLHINLISGEPYSTTWYWFFNHFNLERFSKAVVTESLRQYIQVRRTTLPSLRTLDRDVSCMLSSYSRPIPVRAGDPEDARESPFRELGLMSFLRSSGYYQANHGLKPIHPSIIGYCISRTFGDAGTADITIQRLMKEVGGPGRAFGLTSESLFELLVKATSERNEFVIRGHAGQRALSLPKLTPEDWVLDYFNSNGDAE